MLEDERAAAFNDRWMLYDFWDNSDNSEIRLNAKYEARNIAIKNGHLQLTQRGYSEADKKAFRPMSVAGIQSREVKILYGTFRVMMKVEGANGGSCASFF